MNKNQQIIPELRFPEFEKNWKLMNLGDCIEIKGRIGYRGYTVNDIVEKGEGAIAMSPSNIDDSGIISFNKTTYISWFKYEESPEIKLKDGYTVLVKTGSSYGKSALIKNLPEKCTINPQLVVLKPSEINDVFLSLLVSHSAIQQQISKTIVGGTIPTLSQRNLSEFQIALPTPEEQQKIANCLSSLDDVINAETEKLDLLQDHKKGLLQQLFPAKGETKPKFRFPEFENDGEWVETSLANCLDYLQPTPYLVDNTDYNDKYKTPVLTAGKTFVLGYTNEEKGIYDDKLPVIIFDDFTTATKFVDFPFKVKSSAMKILLAKDDNNIKFIFEAIKNLKFEVSTHKRHWISVYSKLKIFKPKDLIEQQKIAKCLSSVDELIASQQQKIESLKVHKKGLLQKLFPEPSRRVFPKV